MGGGGLGAYDVRAMSVTTEKGLIRLTLVGKRQEAPDTVSFHFGSRKLKGWRPGQHLRYRLPHPEADGRGTTRRFTIASAPCEHNIMLTTRFSAEGSTFKKALRGLRIGGEVEVDELGGGFTLSEADRRHVFLAEGVGAAPYRAILVDLEHRKAPFDVDFFFADARGAFPYRARLSELAGRRPGLRIRWFPGETRIDARAVAQAVGDLEGPMFYVCGPTSFVEAYHRLLRDLGVPESRLRLERFPGYDPKEAA